MSYSNERAVHCTGLALSFQYILKCSYKQLHKRFDAIGFLFSTVRGKGSFRFQFNCMINGAIASRVSDGRDRSNHVFLGSLIFLLRISDEEK